jgi:cyanophycinase
VIQTGILSQAICCLLVCAALGSPAAAKWKYFRSGNAEDSTATPRGGFALMGGGGQDAAFKALCERANGGDFLILRANTEDDYAQKVDEDLARCAR